MDAAGWDARYAASELVWSAGPNATVEELCAALPPGSAVDLACGEGRNALWLAGRGWRVVAVDFSPVAVGKGRRLAGGSGVTVDWVVADVLAWAPSALVDLVVVAYLHLPPAQRRHVVASAAGWLAPGGSLVLVGHDRRNLTEGVGGPQDPDLLWTPDEVEVPGWEVRRRGTAERRVEADGGAATALDTVVHLVRPAGA